jgi:IS1 family transposase
MRKLTTEKRVAILSALVEGNSISSTCRMTGASKVTVLRLLADVGTFCAEYHNVFVRGLVAKRVQVDELWSFCGCKDKAKQAGAGGFGSVWTWVGMDADSKLCVSYLVGSRDPECAQQFMADIADRLESRVQLTSDGYGAYVHAVEEAFEGQIDYAMLVKIFGSPSVEESRRYSPAECKGCKKQVLSGNPSQDYISTSYVERQNLTLRMSSRRFTRLSNGFSKKVENHAHAVALHYFHYNFCRKHMSLKTTPAVAAGIANAPMTVADLVRMVEAEEAKLGQRLSDYLPAAKKSD